MHLKGSKSIPTAFSVSSSALCLGGEWRDLRLLPSDASAVLCYMQNQDSCDSDGSNSNGAC